MPPLRAVVFDLDDTLYAERSYVFSGFQAVAVWAEKQLGIPCDQGFDELCRLFYAGSRGTTFNSWLAAHDVAPPVWVPQMVQVYREHLPQIAPDPEALELLPRLRQRYRLGLVTDGYVSVQKRKLASLDIGSYFDAIVFSDELGPDSWKPSPQPFARVLQKLALAGQEAVYVADNPNKDFLGARKLTMRTVRIRRPDGVYRHLEPPSAEYAPDDEIHNLQDLESLLVRK